MEYKIVFRPELTLGRSPYSFEQCRKSQVLNVKCFHIFM